MIRSTRLLRGRLLVVVGLGLVLTASACSDGATSPTATSTPTSVIPTPTPTATLSPKAEAAALAAAGPRAFDAQYRLRSKRRSAPDASVRVRVTPRRYRVDISHGGQTASLLSGRVGVVSCQSDSSGQTCLLVARHGGRPPRLFDPGLQRLFIAAVPALQGRRHGLTVERAGTWKAPHRYGPAQCFAVSGRVSDPGVYCFLEQGRWRGVLARAEFASGTLSLRRVDQRFTADTAFRPPVRPTPLPS